MSKVTRLKPSLLSSSIARHNLSEHEELVGPLFQSIDKLGGMFDALEGVQRNPDVLKRRKRMHWPTPGNMKPPLLGLLNSLRTSSPLSPRRRRTSGASAWKKQVFPSRHRTPRRSAALCAR